MGKGGLMLLAAALSVAAVAAAPSRPMAKTAGSVAAGTTGAPVSAVQQVQQLMSHFLHQVSAEDSEQRQTAAAAVEEALAKTTPLQREKERVLTLLARMEDTQSLHLTAHQSLLARAAETTTRRRTATSSNNARKAECTHHQETLRTQAEVLGGIMGAVQRMFVTAPPEGEGGDDDHEEAQQSMLVQLAQSGDMLGPGLADALRGYVASDDSQRKVLVEALLAHLNNTAQATEADMWKSIITCDEAEVVFRERIGNITQEQKAHFDAIAVSDNNLVQLRTELTQQKHLLAVLSRALGQLSYYANAVQEAFDHSATNRVVLTQQGTQIAQILSPSTPTNRSTLRARPGEGSVVAGAGCIDDAGGVCSGHGACADGWHACRCDAGWGGDVCDRRVRCGPPMAASASAVVNPAAASRCAAVRALADGDSDAAAMCHVPCALKRTEVHPGAVAGFNVTLRCTGAGEWDGTVPLCRPTTCDVGRIKVPTNAHMRCDGNSVGSTCHFRCLGGSVQSAQYDEGSLTVSCNGNGQWDSAPADACERTLCHKVDAPANGKIDCTGFGFGDMCHVSCDEGHVLHGPSALACGADTSWQLLGSNADDDKAGGPACVPALCPALAKPWYGRYNCTDGGTGASSGGQGSVCTLDCDEGYMTDYPVVRRCLPSAGWSGTQPPRACRRVGCPAPPVASNGLAACPQGTVKGASCLYSCDTGDVTTNEATLTCVDGRHWSGSVNGCDMDKCTTPPYFAHGKASCQPHVKANHWQLSLETERMAYVCTLTCDPGYELDGPDSATCNVEAGRMDIASTCVPKRCGPPPAAAHAQTLCNGDGFGATCRQICLAGYAADAPVQLTCAESGDWVGNASGAAQACRRVQCGPAPSAGAWTCRGHEYGDTCVLSCPTGRVQHGGTTAVCGADGEWLGGEGVCVGDACELVAPVPHAWTRCTGTQVGDTCETGCHAPYRAVYGSAGRTCAAGGLWTGAALECEAPSCWAPPRPVPGGTWQCDATNAAGGHPYLSACRLACNGPQARSYERVCVGDGWESVSDAAASEEPQCGTAGCGPPPSVRHANVTCRRAGECEVRCLAGFSLVGGRSSPSEPAAPLTCQASTHSWDLGELVCAPDMCGPPPLAIGHSSSECSTPITRPATAEGDTQHHVVGAVCAYVCTRDRVYGLECAPGGSWVPASGDRYPPCASRCGRPVPVRNGQIACDDDGGVCRLACAPGHSLKGADSTTCTGFGGFTEQLGVCEPITCPAPAGRLANGQVTCASGHTFGAACDLSCDDGFRLEGAGHIRCGAGGSWGQEEHAACAPVTCDEAVDDEHVKQRCGGKSGGAYTCEAYCAEGMVLSADSAELRHCRGTGKWSAPSPSCEVSACPHRASPANGELWCTGRALGSTCTLTCRNGTAVVGESVRKCMPGGVWSGGLDSLCL